MLFLARLKTLFVSVTLLVTGLVATSAAPPVGYYEPAQGKAGNQLRTALHNLIRNHHVVPYTSTSTDTGDALRILDQDPSQTNYVIEIYSGSNALASAFGDDWNREHLWPNSYGLDGIQPPYSDLHNLRACDASVNSARGNKYYDAGDPNAANYTFPAYPEAPLCSTDTDSWQPPAAQCGDIARALFYMATRYTGDAPNEPALVLTDNTNLITSTNACMGRLSTLLAWHAADPVDAAEQLRNDRVYSLYQTNRNPFVDHPEWVNLTFAPEHTSPPVLRIVPASSGFILAWLATNQSCHLQISTNWTLTWWEVTNPPTLIDGQFQVDWTNSARNVLFRLRAQ